jgi:hypothetical protein
MIEACFLIDSAHPSSSQREDLSEYERKTIEDYAIPFEGTYPGMLNQLSGEMVCQEIGDFSRCLNSAK